MEKRLEKLNQLKNQVEQLSIGDPSFLEKHIQLSREVLGFMLEDKEAVGELEVGKGLAKAKKYKEERDILRNSEKGYLIIHLKEGLEHELSRVIGLSKVNYPDDRS